MFPLNIWLLMNVRQLSVCEFSAVALLMVGIIACFMHERTSSLYKRKDRECFCVQWCHTSRPNSFISAPECKSVICCTLHYAPLKHLVRERNKMPSNEVRNIVSFIYFFKGKEKMQMGVLCMHV